MDHRPKLTRVIADAVALHESGRYAAAVEAWRSAVRLADECAPPISSAELAALLSRYGIACKGAAFYDEAEAAYGRAFTYLDSSVENTNLAAMYHNLGGLEHARGRYELGEAFARRSVAIREKAPDAKPSEFAADIAALAALLDAQGKYAESEPLYFRAIAIFEQAFGSQHLEVGMNLSNLAAAKVRQQKFADAGQLFERSLTIKMNELGKFHPSVGATLYNMGVLEREKGHVAEARALFVRALAILEVPLGPSHPQVSRCRAALLPMA